MNLMDKDKFLEALQTKKYSPSSIRFVEAQPVVDAIPRKWMEQYVKEKFTLDDWYEPFVNGFADMLDEWDEKNG